MRRAYHTLIALRGVIEMGVFLIKIGCWFLDLMVWWFTIFVLLYAQYRLSENAKTVEVRARLDAAMHITLYIVAPIAIIGMSIMYFCGICIPFPL